VAGEVDARSSVEPAPSHPGGPIDVTITRRLALTSGLFYGLLALAGCSGSTQETEIPKIGGLSPGEHRDKMEIEALKAARTRGKSRAGGRR
jgi:hypothetical protein